MNIIINHEFYKMLDTKAFMGHDFVNDHHTFMRSNMVITVTILKILVHTLPYINEFHY